MTWVKVDDRFFDNLTNRALGPAGRDLFVASLCFCAKSNTDGRIPKTELPLLLAQAQAKPAIVRKLVDAGRWTDQDDHYEVVNYLRYQPSAKQVRADRDASARRQKNWRESRRDKQRDNPVSNGERNGVSSPSPSRPVPSPELSSSTNGSSRPPPTDSDDDQHQDPLWPLLAERRAELEHPGGQGIGQPAAYMRTLVNDHRDRLEPQAAALRDEHPDWSLEQLADELDPATATDSRNYLDAHETETWISQQNIRAEQAVPMPEHLRRRAR